MLDISNHYCLFIIAVNNKGLFIMKKGIIASIIALGFIGTAAHAAQNEVIFPRCSYCYNL